ncbi:hypothetical protein LMH87_011917 [Akanthomyces muscarius]|uniref:Uncharacterized protein n=1 Tax=Akanthomyces muscarius TaxID=2231603 RepID=A0A9W8UIX2_AKAMU|nr:hypothetical protein LMH87_011917 [Akanthomyces muscarius]KAJ4151203.1 hypothetical protein LMH87_011917 [Akanthomyces muscarius]
MTEEANLGRHTLRDFRSFIFSWPYLLEAQRQPASLQQTKVTKQQTNMAKRRYLLHDLFRGPEPFEGSIVPTNSTIVALTLLSKCATTIYSCGPSRSPRLESYSSRHCHCCTTSIESNVDTRRMQRPPRRFQVFSTRLRLGRIAYVMPDTKLPAERVTSRILQLPTHPLDFRLPNLESWWLYCSNLAEYSPP